MSRAWIWWLNHMKARVTWYWPFTAFARRRHQPTSPTTQSDREGSAPG